jgi:hypothetical protein
MSHPKPAAGTDQVHGQRLETDVPYQAEHAGIDRALPFAIEVGPGGAGALEC